MDNRIVELEERVKAIEEVLERLKDSLERYVEMRRGGDGSADGTLSAMRDAMTYYYPSTR